MPGCPDLRILNNTQTATRKKKNKTNTETVYFRSKIRKMTDISRIMITLLKLLTCVVYNINSISSCTYCQYFIFLLKKKKNCVENSGSYGPEFILIKRPRWFSISLLKYSQYQVSVS